MIQKSGPVRGEICYFDIMVYARDLSDTVYDQQQHERCICSVELQDGNLL